MKELLAPQVQEFLDRQKPPEEEIRRIAYLLYEKRQGRVSVPGTPQEDYELAQCLWAIQNFPKKAKQ